MQATTYSDQATLTAPMVRRRRGTVRSCATLGRLAVCAFSNVVLAIPPLAAANDGTPILRRRLRGREEEHRRRQHRNLNAFNLRQYSLPAMRYRQALEEPGEGEEDDKVSADEVEEGSQGHEGPEDHEHDDHDPASRYNLVNCTDIPRRSGAGRQRGIYVRTASEPSFLVNVRDANSVGVEEDAASTSLSMEMTVTHREQHLVNGILSALSDAGPNSTLVDVWGPGGGGDEDLLGMTYALAAAASGHHAVVILDHARGDDRPQRMCNSVKANPGFDERVRVYDVVTVSSPSNDTTGADGEDEGADRERRVGLLDGSMDAALPTGGDGPVVLRVDVAAPDGGGCAVLGDGLDYLREADLVHVQLRIGRDSFDEQRDCPRVGEIFDVMRRKGLRPVLYEDGTEDGTYRELDPSEWRGWFGDDEDLALFVSGHLVWKKSLEAAEAHPVRPESAERETADSELAETKSTEPKVEPKHEQISSAKKPLSLLRDHLVNCTAVAEEEDDSEGGVFLKTRTFPRFLINVHDPDLDPSHSGEIEKNGIFEGHMVYEMVREMQKVVAADDPTSSVKPVFVDLGSHIGLYSLAVAAAGFDAIAFEPLESNRRRMCRTVVNNGEEDLSFEDHVRLYSAAVVDDGPKLVALGEVDSTSNPGHAVVRGELVEGAIGPGMREGVDYASGVSLDSIRNDLPSDLPVFVKLDLEGGECGALQGGLEYLSGADVSYVQMEVRSTVDVFFECHRAQEIIDVMDRKGLLPFFFNRPGTSLWKILDPKDWKNWFNGTNGDVGHLVWKRKYW